MSNKYTQIMIDKILYLVQIRKFTREQANEFILMLRAWKYKTVKKTLISYPDFVKKDAKKDYYDYDYGVD